MKTVLTITAIFEALTGIALAIAPGFFATSLLGNSITDPGAILIARLAGAALLTIALACWLSRNNSQSAIMVKAMIAYNSFAIALLLYAALVEKISGPGLWPAFSLHLVLLVWCLSLSLKRA